MISYNMVAVGRELFDMNPRENDTEEMYTPQSSSW